MSKKHIFKTAVVAIIFALGFLYNNKYIGELPSHTHAWAQADRYALSLGFLDNGLNLFKPQTFLYNHQFPDKWQVQSEHTITAVNFPIHDYIVALLMKITGNTSPFIFRLYTLLYSFLGLFFLFKLSFLISNNYIKSILTVIFAATSPVFVYYQGGFLPTIPSLANSIIGIYFYSKHIKTNNNKHFATSIFWLTLATLSRTTFAVPLVAILCIESIRLLKKEIKLFPKLIYVGLSCFSILGYMIYNGYLRNKYGSIFLNSLTPPNNLEHIKELIKSTYNNWVFEYFTLIHYIAFALVIVILALVFITKKAVVDKIKMYFSLFTATYIFGCVIFLFAMLKQFPAHDYYFLDTFYFPIVMLFILFLSILPKIAKIKYKISLIILVVVVSFGLITQPVKSQEKRREFQWWDRYSSLINSYENSCEFMDSLGISRDAKILVVDAIAPNIPFILMQRKGLAVITTKEKNIKNSLNFNYDYIVTQNEYFVSNIYRTYPNILSHINIIADNGKISIYTPTKNKKQTLLDMLGLNNKKPIFETYVSFDSTANSLWTNTNQFCDIKAFSGTKSGLLAPNVNYGLTYKTTNLPELKSNYRKLLFSSYFFKETNINSQVVVYVNSNGKTIYYKSYNLDEFIKQKNTWERVSIPFQLPKIESNNYEFGLFISNSQESESNLYYDDFGFAIY